MTPEKAHELRQGAQRGPWEYTYPIVKTKGGAGLLTAADPEYGVIGEGDGPLVAAAPELAEIVANMHYEYVVEARMLADAAPSVWMPCDSWGLTGYDSMRANEPWAGPRRWRAVGAAEMCADNARAYGDRDVRIVRRLVTDVEAIE